MMCIETNSQPRLLEYFMGQVRFLFVSIWF